MLNQIHIRNLATIEDQHLHLNRGTTMLTGETGAGKSIFIEAIELALGGRGSTTIIRPGKDRADISLCFEIGQLPRVTEWLQNADLYQEETHECLIRRVLTDDGRSRSYINGLPTTLPLVRELAELLFHLHGQYEQQMLLKAENQRDILDRFAEHMPLANTVKHLAAQWKNIERDIRLIREKTKDRDERRDYLRFQLDEITTLQPRDGEWATLESEHHLLTHSEELLRNLQRALQCLSDDNGRNILTLLNDMRKSLEAAQSIEPKVNEWLNTLNSTFIQLTDLESELCNHLEKAELDPERLQFVETRISQLFALARKHKITPEALFAHEAALSAELATLESSDTALATLEAQQAAITAEYQLAAQKLSLSRTAAAAKLADHITRTIRSLSLPHGDFTILLEKNNTDLSAHGLENITFLIKTNPDQAPQPLAKVISGGELSRLSLAVHLALAHATTTPTLIFDEVDTGVGGATAEKIGKLLRQLGDNYQVFCVTHQAQVASLGHHHLLVEKHTDQQSTHTRLRFLTPEERTHEIARMLGGATITPTTIKHAKEILALV